jgi:hypothetical protein
MRTLESFLESSTKPPDYDLAQSYHDAEKQFDAQQTRLMRYIRARKDGKEFLPVFEQGIESIMPELEHAEMQLQEMRKRIENYLECLGEFGSMAAMIEKLAHMRRSLDNIERDAKNITEAAIRTSGLPPERVATESQDVVDVLNKRDRMRLELEPAIADVQRRINRIKELINHAKT